MFIQSKADIQGEVAIFKKKAEDYERKKGMLGNDKTEEENENENENNTYYDEDNEEDYDEENEEEEEGFENYDESYSSTSESESENSEENENNSENEEEDREEEEEDYHFRRQTIRENPDEIKEGRYSMFKIAIKKNYQGVAYLMLQNGYSLLNAIQVIDLFPCKIIRMQ